MLRTALLLTLVFSLSACGLLGGGGGGGGGAGGGGGQTVNFASGFVYVRKDDRNLYLADATDYQTTGVLTSGGGVSMPSLSKDAKQIVYVHKTAVETELLRVPVSGGAPSTVLRASGNAKNFRNPVFSPDGGLVVFGYDEGIVPSVGRVEATGANFAKIVGGGSLGYGSPSFSPDGTRVLVAAGTPGSAFTQLEWVNVDTAVPAPVTNTLGNEAMGIVSRVVASPDGTKAAFDAQVSSGVTRIFVIDLATRLVTKVNEYAADPTANDTAPCWIGVSRVGFSSDSGGNDNVYQVTSAGAGRELLVPKAVEPWYGPLP